MLKIHLLDFFPYQWMRLEKITGLSHWLAEGSPALAHMSAHSGSWRRAWHNWLQHLGQKVGFHTNFQRWQSSVPCRLSKTLLNYCRTTRRKIFRYRVTDIFRRLQIKHYHASDKIVGILLARSWSHDAVKITVLGVEIRIGRVIEFEAGGEQSKMADDGLVAMDISWWFSTSTDCLTV